MELKKRLSALAKRMSPQIEAMNPAYELRDIIKRAEEILDYCEAKQKKPNRSSQATADAIQAERERIQKIHDEEAEELARDQQQHKAQPDVEPPPPKEVIEREGVTKPKVEKTEAIKKKKKKTKKKAKKKSAG